MKIYYIANARMPTEKAHGIQIAKMCEAFIEAGTDLTLVVPRRATERLSVQEYYGLRVPVPLICLPAIDWYTGGRVGYAMSSLSFMLSYSLFVFRRKMAGEKCILYTVDLDNYSSSVLAFLGRPLFSEMHGAKPSTIPQRMLFNRASGIIAINKIIAEELRKSFPRSSASYLVEPNGVDPLMFAPRNMSEARAKLGLPQGVPTVLYAGRFFAWKGLEIIPQAAVLTPEVRFQMVGGAQETFSALVKEALPANMQFAGDRPHGEMPLWIASANAVLVLGTKRDTQSYYYTSPMKLFEYLLSERAIVASDTPAIREIVGDEEAIFYRPDDAKDLADNIRSAVSPSADMQKKIITARRKGESFSWQGRALRIIRFMEQNA